ncbi:MAG TPA: hypothetical protein DET40_10245 [Lentisphaeria bacterium]|nr:MAG: hypothetical protein A2X45_10035 [Lentisphaerae bacterium GWF2_50_93]HCE43916.1 hypothetical protein [Lentisphaeria bacterium]
MKIKYLVQAGAVVAIGTLSMVCYKPFSPVKVPDPKSLTQDGIAKAISSDSFSKLPQEKKDEYLEKITPADPEKGREIFASVEKMTDEEKKNFHENMRPAFQKMMQKRVDEYFAMTPEKKEEFLDREIERMNEMRKGGNGGPGGPGRGPPPKPDVQHLKNMFETQDPVTKAKMHQFFRDMHQRAERRTGNK